MNKYNKRKDKNKKLPRYQAKEINTNIAKEEGGLKKSILILVEGETEEAYFNGLKSNEHLKKQLAGVKIERSSSGLSTMLFDAMKGYNDGYEKVWLVYDNDKRNAFILDGKSLDRLERKLSSNIFENIKKSAINHCGYFLSISDYINWISAAIGSKETIWYWDTIQHCTTKSRDFEKFTASNPYALFLESELFKNKSSKKHTYTNPKSIAFDHNWKSYTQIAYSCIAFEFWLLLHFEKTKVAFLLVDKDAAANTDVATFLREQYCPNYVKGFAVGEKKKNNPNSCTAYQCLFDNNNKAIPTLKEQRKVLLRLINAYRNTLWLKMEMAQKLKKQNNKWYEVNPYIYGLDEVIKELLNIQHCNSEINYFGWTITFRFINNTLTLSIKNEASKMEILNEHHHKFFEIVSQNNTSYFPTKIPTTKIEANEITENINIRFNIPDEEQNNLTLFFQDPRKTQSSELIILLGQNGMFI